MRTITILRADGREEQHAADDIYAAIERLLDAPMLDAVNLRDGRTMFVDDDGWETEAVEHGPGHVELHPVRARKPVNVSATALYHAVCKPGTTHRIVGDVAIVTEEPDND